jgi:tetratricopeptide (TPR) repeat protein
MQVFRNTLIGDAATEGPWSSVRVAVECRRFQEAVDQLYPSRAALDPGALVQLALALEGVGRGTEALQLLTERRGKDTDAMGVLAGRLKRRWSVERDESDARRAMDLYQEAYSISTSRGDWAQAYYHGINLAFLELAWKSNVAGARNRARTVLGHCAEAVETELPPDRKWRLATEGEARLILGEFDDAVEGYRRALSSDPPPEPREIDSMYHQATLLLAKVGTQRLAERLEAVFRGPME